MATIIRQSFRKFPRASLLVVGLSLVTAFLSILHPVLLSSIVDSAQTGELKVRLLIVLGLILCADFVLDIVTSRVLLSRAEKYAHDLRSRVIGKLFRLKTHHYKEATSSRAIVAMTSDIALLKTGFLNGGISVVGHVLTAGVALIAMVIMDWKLFMIVLGVTVVAGVVVGCTAFLLKAKIRGYQHQTTRLTGLVSQSLEAVLDIKAASGEDYVEAKVGRENGQLYNAALRAVRIMSFLKPIQGSASNIAVLAVVLAGGLLIATQSLDVGTFLAFFYLVFLFVAPLASVLGGMSSAQTALAAEQRVVEFLELEEEIYESGTEMPQSDSPPELTVGELHLPQLPHPLRVNLSVASGKSVALVGPSGVGKSSFLQALVGLGSHEGMVRLGEQEIRDMGVHELRGHMYYMKQKPVAYGTDVQELIAFGVGARCDRVEAALHRVGLNHLLESSEDLLAGTRAVDGAGTFDSLSGGEMERVGVARCLVQDQSIVLLDEPTSALDPLNQAKVEDIVFNDLSKRTRIVATHRIDWLNRFDAVLFLDQDGVVLTGTFDELRATSACFRAFLAKESALPASELVTVR